MTLSFNYASSAPCFRFLENKKPEVLIVNYINEENKIEKRFPSGTVQFIDPYKTMEWYIELKNITDSRNPILWFPMFIMDLESKFNSEVVLCKTRHEKNILFGSYLSKINNKLFSFNLNKEDLLLIFQKSRLITLQREIHEETDASKFGKFVEASFSLVGDHERCCYTSVEVDAPDYFTGSGDSDIQSSYWELVENVENKISKKHLNYFLASVHKAIEEKMDKRINELRPYDRATNY